MSEYGESYYMDEDTKQKFVRVTTVTGCAAKPALYAFYGKHGTKKAKEIAEEASAIGTSVHSYIESYFLKSKQANVLKKGAKVRQGISNFHKFQELAQLEPVVYNESQTCLELTVFSETHGYAGTIDGLFRNKRQFNYYVGAGRGKKKKKVVVPKNTLLLTDWKTSAGIYQEVQLQESAYLEGLTELMEHGKIVLEGVDTQTEDIRGLVVRLDKQKTFKQESDIAVYEVDTLKRAFHGFLGLLDYYKWKTGGK